MKRFFKILKWLAIAAISIFVAALIYVISFSLTTSIPKHADAAVILGAKVNLDNSPSEPLYDRSIEAVTLFKKGLVNYVIATGGQGLGRITESRLALKIAELQGVPKDKIFIETESHSTYENIANIQKIAAEHQIKSLVVVSDNFHLARGVLVAKHFGFSPIYWDAPKDSYYTKTDLAWNYIREAFAIIYYIPKLLLTPVHN